MLMRIKIIRILLFCALCSILIVLSLSYEKHFFYSQDGVLIIDGSVPGESGPITVDMKDKPFTCNRRQYFTFEFCPKVQDETKGISSLCEEGITFCYEPTLTEESARDKYVLSTDLDSIVSKQCGEMFRGFKVGLIHAYNIKNAKKKRMFYEIQTAFNNEPYYFEIPDNRCIELWLGSPNELSTTVKNFKRAELSPVQVYKHKHGVDSVNYTIVGLDSETYSYPWPDKHSTAHLSDHPALLKMLYVDFKSKEFVPQMMYTIAPKKKCHLFAYVSSNDVGSCKSSFKQRANAIRPVGNHTSYTLTIESGVDTNDTKGTKSAQTEILNREYEEGTEQIIEDIFRDEGIQSLSETLGPIEENILETSSKTTVEKEDKTPLWKKVGAKLINMASAGACMGLAVIAYGYAGCRNKVGFQDVEQTTFHEAYTKKELSNTKTAESFSLQHSRQNTLQRAFTHSKSVSTETSLSEMDSLSNLVSKRTISQYSIQIPENKTMIPMQMAVDCDGNDVKIPWIRLRLVDEVDGEGQEDEEYSQEQEESDDENELYDYAIIHKLTKQQEEADRAYNQKFELSEPHVEDEEMDYSKYTGLKFKNEGDDAKDIEPDIDFDNYDDSVDYGKYTGQKIIPGINNI